MNALTIEEALVGKTIACIEQDAHRTLVLFTDGTIWQILLGDSRAVGR